MAHSGLIPPSSRIPPTEMLRAPSERKQAKSAAAGAPSLRGEHSPTSWPKLAPAEMYRRPLELEWDGGAAATENLERFICRGHPGPRARPANDLRESLVMQLEDLVLKPETTHPEG